MKRTTTLIISMLVTMVTFAQSDTLIIHNDTLVTKVDTIIHVNIYNSEDDYLKSKQEKEYFNATETQDETNINTPQNIEFDEDDQQIITINDIINEQQIQNTQSYQIEHWNNVWDRRTYLNLTYNTGTLSPTKPIHNGIGDGIVPDYKSNYGANLTVGRSYRLHKRAIANMIQFCIDYTYVDLTVSHYEAENGGIGNFDSRNTKIEGNSEIYYLPWNLEKYEVSYGMAIGPSITIAPFATTKSKGAHFLKLNLWYHIGYHASGLIMNMTKTADINTNKNSEGYQNMQDSTPITWGYGTTNTFGLSLTWKAIGIGYEHRSAKLKYKAFDTDNFGEEKYEFNAGQNRIFIQFRM